MLGIMCSTPRPLFIPPCLTSSEEKKETKTCKYCRLAVNSSANHFFLHGQSNEIALLIVAMALLPSRDVSSERQQFHRQTRSPLLQINSVQTNSPRPRRSPRGGSGERPPSSADAAPLLAAT
jgi:hypothetical protein